MKKFFIVLFTIIIASVILLSLTSCSKEKAQPPKNQPGATKNEPKKDTKVVAVKKACDVFSADEASEAMGVSLVESSDPNDANVAPTGPEDSYCSFTNNGSTDDTRRKIFVSLALSSNANGAKMAFNATKNITPDAETVNNLGDGAFWNPNNDTLVVVKGRYQLLIHIDQPENGGIDKAKAAANVIIPRL